ncbi:MAG TPA: hypothetical protein VGX46_18685 [Vicinamibacterales bacterium]|nr:hypothetical protein [Vicinamibacterales bacterium]
MVSVTGAAPRAGVAGGAGVLGLPLASPDKRARANLVANAIGGRLGGFLRRQMVAELDVQADAARPIKPKSIWKANSKSAPSATPSFLSG